MKKPETICYTLTSLHICKKKMSKKNPIQTDRNSVVFEIKLKICVL